MLKLIFVAALFLANVSWAGFVKGNGGNTLVCKLANGKVTVELLDFAEANAFLKPNTLHFTNLENKTKEKILSNVLNLISDVMPQNSYAQWLADFDKEAIVLNGVSLGIVADSYHFVIPKNCIVEQTVIQIEPIFHEARYTVNGDLWAQLTPGHQAGLLMHELVYRDIKSTDSRQARLITSYLFSDEIQKLTLVEKKTALKKLGFIER